MTVSSTTARVSYSGNGSTVAFSVTFYFLANTDLQVIIRAADGTETVKTITTDYTVTGAGDPAGGTVTFGTAPASGTTVVIVRNVALTQQTDYQANDPFPAETHESALDKLTMLAQQIQDGVNRSIKLSKTNTMTSTEFTVGAANRANKILAFDSAGEIAVTQEIGTYRGNWASGTAYQQRDIIKDTSNNNIYICVTAHTASGSQPISTNTDAAKWALIVDAAAAASSASAAAASAAAAALSETAAETAETNAETAQTAAETAQAAAETAQAAAEAAQAAAETAETNAETAETNAETAATNAASSASAASTSATNAASSASAASTSASNASSSASAASTSASNAASSASAASTSETNAASSASAAASSASAASTSASNAATSETAAAASAVSAASSASSAAALLDNFDDRYLGAKSSDPSVDNDGNALVVGALYFNTTDGVMKVYTASGWIAASSASVATLTTFEYVATSGQTSFSGNDANGNSLSYTANAIFVTLNGVRLRPGDDYTATDGTTLTLVSGATVGDELVIDAFGNFLIASVDGANIVDGTTNISKLNATGTRSGSTFLAGDNTFKTVAVTPTAVSDQNNTSTGYFDLPSGTTAERPASPTNGMVRYNTTLNKMEAYENGEWIQYSSTYLIDYLAVAGGGAGGISNGGGANGGGGAGGLLQATNYTIISGTSLTITIGAGGAGSGGGVVGQSGSNTTIAGFATAVGGGGGGTRNNGVATSGGSGGGAGNDSSGAQTPGSGTSGQGYAGGAQGANSGTYAAGGGGGAGGVGGNGNSSGNGGNGGVGINWQSLGTYYAGGGGGGTHQTSGGGTAGGTGGNGGGGNGGLGSTSNIPATSGTANRGGGGGGNGQSEGNSGSGGSGIVIIRYLGSQKGTGGTVTSSGGYTYHTFTSSGTFTA